MVDFKTGEVFINDAKAVEALQFYGDLITKYKLVPPDAMTWQFEEIVAGGQRDRYAMVQMFAPYGTLINDPKLSKTGGKVGMDHGSRATQQGGRPHLDRRPHNRRPEIQQEQGMGTGVRGDVLRPRLAEAGDDSAATLRRCARYWRIPI